MPFNIDWSLANPINAGEMFAAGLERGTQQREQREQKSALSAYAVDPSKQNLNALAPYNPQFVMQQRQAQEKRALETQQQGIRAAAIGGDSNAMKQLGGFDTDTWMKLDEHTREKAKQTTAMLGQTLWQIGQLPEEQKAAAWAQSVQQFEASGQDIPPQYEQYSPQAFNALLAETEQTKAYIQAQEPHWVPTANGGLVNTKDPASIAAYQASMGGGGQPAAQAPKGQPVQIKGAEDYNNLPPGAHYIDPNGVPRTKGGAAPSGAQTFP